MSYQLVLPPELMHRLWQIKERTGVPIVEQVRMAVRAYLDQVELMQDVGKILEVSEVV
jgi:predicted DNA-binding protein